MGSVSSNSTSPLLRLADDIHAGAKIFAEALKANGLPDPSFDADGPTRAVPAEAPQSIHDACNAIADASFKLFQLVTGPSELLPNFQASYQTMFALQWLLHFNVLKAVPLGKSVLYGDVATQAKVPESQLKSIARMAMTSNILCEPQANHLAHTATSVMFLTNKNMVDWASFMFEASIPSAAGMVTATEKWPGSVQKSETAYNVAFNHDLPFFEHLSKSPALTEQFSGYMKNVTGGRGTDLVHLVKGYDWDSLPEHSLIVDVGGSTGNASFTLAEAFPGLRFEVQDLEPVIMNGFELLKTQPSHVAGRVSFRSHDFSQKQPVSNAAVYVLRMIIHDWPDAEASKILNNIALALGPKSTLLIMDTVLPDPGTIPLVKERLLRVRDLTMGQVFNSKERSIQDWKDLLQSSEPRLELAKVTQPEGSHMSLMLVRLQAE
ncbi:hypothetical protein QQS21_000008 [Conoideocrella luteorostrata]|uniref:O-methyltransferase C-terminal domain-containing protein n=1 Tax=Conoideocrella luteorostrata TaxID=1105319 RepID=A0AAJ0D1M7_9HYPO|nr:hypothetical protein QQS21_000008 [Conoideocrella luteorostrata]